MDLDPAVLAGLRAGKKHALEACYEAFGGRVLRLCQRMLLQVSDAEDATQEVFLKVYQRAGQFEGRSRFSTWLHGVTVRHCLSRLERERVRATEPMEAAGGSEDPGPGPLQRAHESEVTDRLEALLQRLPPSQRAVLVLRELEGLSYAEMAQALAIPEGTVMSRLARARERLAAMVHGAAPACDDALPSEQLNP